MQPNELKAYQKHKGLRYFSKEEFREIYANVLQLPEGWVFYHKT